MQVAPGRSLTGRLQEIPSFGKRQIDVRNTLERATRFTAYRWHKSTLDVGCRRLIGNRRKYAEVQAVITPNMGPPGEGLLLSDRGQATPPCLGTKSPRFG